MDRVFHIAGFGELVAEPSRVAMLLSLIDGCERPASELADIAGVTASTASIHLRRLVEGRLLEAARHGRHRYFRIASQDAAGALEAIAVLQPPSPALQRSPQRRTLAAARTCYGHLAGELGVALRAAMERQRLLAVRDGAPVLTPRGIARFTSLGLDPERWPEGKLCLDWTERRSHLGGPLGALLTGHFFALRWIARRNSGRSVRVADAGRRALLHHLGVRAPEMAR